MLFKDISIVDEEFNIKNHMYLGVKDNIIAYLDDVPPEAKNKFSRIYKGKGKLLMPGFVNNHAHSPMTLMRGYGENMVLSDWLNKRIFPFEAKLKGEDVYWGTLLAICESLRFGITSTTDMYYFSEDMAKAILETGVKNNLSRSIVNFQGEKLFNLEGAKEMRYMFENYHMKGDGRLRIDMSLHGEYTSDENTVRELSEYTKAIGANMHVHVSETLKEHEECKKKYGKTPTAYLSDLGLFDTCTTAAHCVHVEDKDMEILKEKKVTVASNPMSNLKLASGVANVPELLKRGINVTIGTDSVASNNSLNFLEEMKVFSLVSKMAFKDPTCVTPKETVMAATINGARAQGRYDTGVIKEGMRADLIVLDIDKPNMYPAHSLLSNIVYANSGADVLLTMVEGKVLYEEGTYFTLDVKKVIAEAEKAKTRILSLI